MELEKLLTILLTTTLLSPAVIVGVIIFTNNLLSKSINKRIDDLRDQMTREHDTLANKVDETNLRLGKIEQNHLDHITRLHTQPNPSNP
jgi:hypothetical protein